MGIRTSFIQENLFIKDFTPESVYLLGFIWADGCLSSTLRYASIITEIAAEDMTIISKIFDKVGIWSTYYRKPREHKKNWKQMCTKYTSNKKLWQHLFDYDYRSKDKSPCKILKLIPENLRFYWWRGYFDGDGCIGKSQRSKYCHITSCKTQDWTFWNKLMKKLNITNHACHDDKTHGRVMIANFDGIKKFFKYIYPNGYDFGFKRKYDKFLTTLNITNSE